MARDLAEDLIDEARDVEAQLGAMENYLREVAGELQKLADSNVTKDTTSAIMISPTLKRLKELQIAVGRTLKKENKDFGRLSDLLKQALKTPGIDTEARKKLSNIKTDLLSLENLIINTLSMRRGEFWKLINDLKVKEISVVKLRNKGYDTTNLGRDIEKMLDTAKRNIGKIIEYVDGAISIIKSMRENI